jgi:hypothetical protein
VLKQLLGYLMAFMKAVKIFAFAAMVQAATGSEQGSLRGTGVQLTESDASRVALNEREPKENKSSKFFVELVNGCFGIEPNFVEPLSSNLCMSSTSSISFEISPKLNIRYSE